MSVLVLVESQQQQLAANTLSLITAAAKLQQDIHVLVLGQGVVEIAKTAAELPGIQKVLCADHAVYANYNAEAVSDLLCHLSSNYSMIMAPASSFGKNIMPRVAGQLNQSMVSDVIEIIDQKTFKRPIYAGNAIATVISETSLQLLTIRTTAFEKAAGNSSAVAIEKIDFVGECLSRFESEKLTKTDRPELTAARVVVAGGRGLQSKAGFEQLQALADQWGAALGASRAAVDAGFVPNDFQVGQTGKIVAPEVYVAFGISGAVQHLAGIKDSKVIFAIDKDPEAPIFQAADFGFVGDVFQVLEQLKK